MRWALAGLLVVLLVAACSSPRGGRQGTALVMQRPIGTFPTSGIDAGVITEVYVPVVFNRGAPHIAPRCATVADGMSVRVLAGSGRAHCAGITPIGWTLT